MVVMMVSFRYVGKIFGDQPAARLPFEPTPFFRKVTQRGLVDAEPDLCSAVSGLLFDDARCAFPPPPTTPIPRLIVFVADFHLRDLPGVHPGARDQNLPSWSWERVGRCLQGQHRRHQGGMTEWTSP